MWQIPIIGAVFLVTGMASAAPRTERRVVILAVDGLRPDHLRFYLTRPAYAELRKQGFLASMLGAGRARLSPEGRDRTVSAFPSYTWPAWGTVFTGHFPGRHGVFGQTFLLRDGRGWSGAERGQYFDADKTFTDGPHSYGWEFDGTGKKKIDGAVGKLGWPLDKVARRALSKLEGVLAGAVGEKTFTLEKLLSGFRSAGKSAVTQFLRVPTLYDVALENKLRAHVVFNFYHPKSRNADDAETYSRPDKETVSRIGLANLLGKKLMGGDLEGMLRSILWALDKIGKAHVLDPVLKPLRQWVSGPLLGDPVLPDKYVNRVRGHVYHDQKAARVALDLVRRTGDVPHVFTVYQAGLDECSHKIAGDADALPDIQARCLGFVDRNLKPVMDAIRSTPAWKDTLVVLVSDHGHTRGHRAADPKVRIGEGEIETMLAKGANISPCQMVQARNGHMAHLYLMPNKRVLEAFRNEAKCPKPGGRAGLRFDEGKAAKVAAALARRPDVIPRGIAALFARSGDRYRIYYARRWKGAGPVFARPEGMELEAFDKRASAFGFVELARRVGAANDPERSGDLLVVTDPEAKFSFSGSPGTHGGLLAEDSWATLTFFGPAVSRAARGVVKLRRALQVDIAPSILRFLGIDPGTMSGRSLFDEALRPLR